VMAIWLLLRYQRDRWIRFAFALMFAAWVLTLGWKLTVDGRPTAIPLPWRVFENAPVLGSLLAVRVTLYVWLFATLLASVGLDRAHDEVKLGRRSFATEADRPWPRSRRVLFASVVVLLTSASVVALLPGWPYSGTGPADVPSYFSSGAVNRIPYDSVVLISPYPSYANPTPLVWQAVAGFRFKILGGYGEFALPSGAASVLPAALTPNAVESFLGGEVSSIPGFFGGKTTMSPGLVAEFRLFLRRYRVGTVLYSATGAHPRPVYQLFSTALGPPSAPAGSIIAWYDVQKRLGSNAKA
jgi:hypothetical protein